ncbi:MAG: flagellin [Syntrophaceae bacterium]|nr:flagellin [Syntrophaceae bacterium]
MGFRIQNNVAAMNAHRWLSTSDSAMSKSLERLSSGYRINRAADDAAGLAISSNFRANIASFQVASRNTSEASALLQVAEGGMEQIENMLVRLKELATQAASANVGSTERAKINSEGNALISEIDRIANSTKYGSTTLLDGTFGSSKSGTVGVGSEDGMIGSTNNAYTMTGGTDVMSGATVVAIGSGLAEATTWYFGVNSGGDTLYLANAATYSTATLIEAYTGTINAANSAVTFANLGMTIAITGSVTGIAGVSSGTSTFDNSVALKRTGLTSLVVEGANTGTYTFSVAAENKLTLSDGTTTETIDYVADTTHTFSALGIPFSLSSATEGYDENDLEGMTITVTDTGSSGSTFQIGAENNTNNRIAITISDTTTGSAGLNLSMDQLDTASEAQTMLTTINSAVSTLSDRRGDIGAYMNRLTYAAANLAATIENTQSAESLIRDVDMAAEMTSFTKNQILLQAGTAMLAQANMAPQSVLSLFG